MSRVSSPVPVTMEQALQDILNKLHNMDIKVSVLVKENENRTREIALLGESVGLKSKIETDIEYTSDNTEEEKEDKNESKPINEIESQGQNFTPSINDGIKETETHSPNILGNTKERKSEGQAQLRNTSHPVDNNMEVNQNLLRNHDCSKNKTIEKAYSSISSEEEEEYNYVPIHQLTPSINKIPAKDLIRIIKPLNGQDDIGVEDFIKTVKRAQKRCSQPELLLDYILAEKITQQAEKCIRYTQINDFETLYETLRSNLKQMGSVSALRSKLDSCKQGMTETIQNYNIRFRQVVNELKYAVQAAHSLPMKRRIAIDLEEEECLKKYLLNLRREIGLQVKAQKPSSLAEAQNNAIEMEMWLKEAQPSTFTRNSTTFKTPIKHNPLILTKQFIPQKSQANINVQNKISQNRSAMNCHKCGKLGHFANQCFVKTNFQQGQYLKRPPDQAIRNIQEEKEEEQQGCLHSVLMSQEEIEEQNQYEEMAEYQAIAEDYNPYWEEEVTEQHIDY